jgi:CrcB protein
LWRELSRTRTSYTSCLYQTEICRFAPSDEPIDGMIEVPPNLHRDDSAAKSVPTIVDTEVVQRDEESTSQRVNSDVGPSLLRTAAVIAILAIPGCCIRSGLGDAAHAPVQGYILPNFIGSALLAIAASNRDSINRFDASLYTGFTTGFCGSLTTFSSWQQTAVSAITGLADDVECAWGNTRFPNSSSVAGGRLYAWLELILGGLAVGLVGYDFGHLIGRRLKARIAMDRSTHRNFCGVLPCDAGNSGSKNLAVYLLALGAGSALIAGAVVSGTAISYSLLFAPVGALVRWILSFANAKSMLKHSFPFGTFCANIAGSVLITVLAVLSQVSGIGDAQISGFEFCPLLEGLAVGFCGSLTTVSTWMSELRKLELGGAWAYGIATVVCAQVVMTLVVVLAFASTSELPAQDSCGLLVLHNASAV